MQQTGALEVVVMRTGSLPATTSSEDVLNGGPGDRVDQRVMDSGIFDVVEGDDTLVAGVRSRRWRLRDANGRVGVFGPDLPGHPVG